MPKKPGTNPKGEFAFFDVVYEDDSQRSNRRVPADLLGGLDGDEPARAFIREQDREIAEKSGRRAARDQEHQPGRGEEEVRRAGGALALNLDSGASGTPLPDPPPQGGGSPAAGVLLTFANSCWGRAAMCKSNDTM